MSPEQTLPWLREARTISKDELGIFCIGALPCPTSLKSSELLLPCFDAQEKQVIINGHLIQLGQKTIQKAADTSKDVALDSCQLVALTVWKDEFSDQEWTSLLKNTNQVLRQLLGDVGNQDAIINIWGRSVRNGNRASNEQHARSIQVHCTVPHTRLSQLLANAKSGFAKVYVAPKTPEGRIDEQWCVLWISGDLPRVSAIATQITRCLGLIRGKNALGLRFTTQDYPAAWNVVHPNEPVPSQTGGAKERLSPLPYGCNQDTLTAWAKHVQWSLRPLKAVGPKTWLVCTNDDPPAGLLLFNSNPVIAELIPPKTTMSTQAIPAGPKPSNRAVSSVAAASVPNQPDPWTDYRLKRGLPTGPQPVAPRNVEGPTQAEFTKA